MNKAEMLKQKAQQNTMNLYLTNEDEIKNSNIEQNTIKSMQDTKTKDESRNENIEKMLSFRLPTNIIENIDKYAYIQRMKKKDAIIMCFETFFNDNKVKDILKQYDNIKRGN